MTDDHDATPRAGILTQHITHPDAATSLLIDGADAISERAEQRDRADGERSMRRAVAAFNALYGTRLSEYQGWQFMALLKMSRAGAGPFRRDDFVDEAAYAALAGECALDGALHGDVARSLHVARTK